MRRDIYEAKPEGMVNYLSAYGWHFSKKMAEWAISKMKDRNGNKVTAKSKEEIEAIVKEKAVTLNAEAYDAVYVYAMAKSDFYGSSITTEQQLIQFVADYSCTN